MLTLSLPEVVKVKSKQNFQISFCKMLKTNSTMGKYCWRGFIWMLTLTVCPETQTSEPRYNTTLYIIQYGSEKG